MAKETPTKSKLRRGSSAIKRSDRLAKASESSPSLSDEQLNLVKDQQERIDEYNQEEIHIIDPFFKTLQLGSQYLVIRLFKENYIKYIDESNPDDIQLDAWHRQIDARERTADVPKYVSTPFPYLEQGVITAISPELQLSYHKMKEEMAKYDKEAADSIDVPKVGDVIRIKARTSVWFKEHRYYIDKQTQCLDFVRNQTELRLNNFQHYFLMESHDIEGIVKETSENV